MEVLLILVMTASLISAIIAAYGLISARKKQNKVIVDALRISSLKKEQMAALMRGDIAAADRIEKEIINAEKS